MISDISIYKDTKRNGMCPCGSGKIFKKCCKKEYREIRRSMANAKCLLLAGNDLQKVH